MAREILGHIDCPCCGTVKGMRITHDRNGEPFGFCEANCNQQMRVGGDKRRVAAFVARYPWAGGRPADPPDIAPPPVTAPVPAPAPKAPAKVAAKPAPAPTPTPKPAPAPYDPFAFLRA